MEAPDLQRWNRVRAALDQAKIDALICRLPENVVMLSGYWPTIGRSLVLFPLDGEPALLAPAFESSKTEQGWIPDVRAFRAWRLGDADPEESIEKLLAQLFDEKGIRGKRIGYEGSFGDVAPCQKVMEGWAGVPSALNRYRSAMDGEWVDFGPQLASLAGVKSEREIARIRVANEVADFGLAAFFREAVPGRKETEIAAAVESAVLVQGIGHKGVGTARAAAEIISGPRTPDAWNFPTSTSRVVDHDDLVMIELAVVADGYWSDLTRTVVAGNPSQQQRDALAAQRAAYTAALGAMRPGAASVDVDEAGRKALEQFGLRDLFVHHTGHGLGFRYHEPIPFVHPDSQGILEEGMITSLEPGLYSEALGGVRIEDDIVITASGAEPLCASPRWPQLRE